MINFYDLYDFWHISGAFCVEQICTYHFHQSSKTKRRHVANENQTSTLPIRFQEITATHQRHYDVTEAQTDQNK